MPIEPEKLARLPRWAQLELRNLASRLAVAERDLAEARGAIAQDATDTLAHPYDDVPLALPAGASVAFRLGPTWRDTIRVRIRDGRLNLNGDSGLMVLPRASNDVDVILGRH